MLFLLLFVGTNAAWARPTIYGEGLPGLNASGAANWDSNTKEMSAYGEANTYYAEFLNVAATDNSTYRFKIAVNNGGNWWDGAMCGLKSGNYNNVSQSKGNVEIVEGKSDDNQISFKMPFAGDVYVFYKSDNNNNEKVWIVAVPKVSAIGNTTAQSKTMKFDLLVKNSDWYTSINFIKNDVDALTYKYVTSYIAPACTSSELSSSKPPRVRCELYGGSSTFNGKDSPYSAELTTSVQRVIYLWNGICDDGNRTNAKYTKYLIPTYPNRSSESGWKLWVHDGKNNISGDLSEGSVTVQIDGGKTIKYFITNSSAATGPSGDNFRDQTRHSVNSFGGCYVDKTASSNVTFGSDYQIYNKKDGTYKLGNIAKPIVAENDMRGSVTIDGSGAKDVTFTFDGGKITINAVDHVEAFSGDFYVYGAGSNAQNWVTGWSSTDQGGGKANPANHMTITNNVARKTYYGVKGDNLEFKVSNGTNDVGTWSNYSTSKQSGVSASANDQNIRFSLSNASDVTVCYDGANVWLEVKERQKPNDAWRVTGTFNGWSKDNDQMLDDATNRCKKVTLTNVTKAYDKNGHGWIKFKIFKGTDWNDNINKDNATIIGLDGTEIGTVSDDNESDEHRILVQVDAASDITFCYYTYSDGTNIVTIKRTAYVAPVVSGIDYDGTEYIFMDRRQMGFSDNIAMSDATCWIEFSNGSESAGTQYAAFMSDDNTLASLAPAGTWTKVRVARGGQDAFTTEWGTSGWLDIDTKEKNYITQNIGGWSTYTFPNSRFFVATPQDINNPTGSWNWNGDGTLRTNSYTKTLAANELFIFKLTRDYTRARANVRWSMEGNYTHYNSSSSNLSNTECSNINNNQIKVQLDHKADVTITWENYDKIVITKTPYYNVTFDSDGGSAMDAQELRSGENATNPGTPERGSGYTFNFWKLSGESIAYDFSTPVTSDIELVADWTAPTLYTVRFMDGETELTGLAQNVAEGAYASEPDPAPTKSGYSSVKWQLNGVDYNFSNPVTGNITLDAVWVAKTLESISLNHSSLVMVLDGPTATLTPSYLPADLIPAQQPTYDWSVSPSGYVTVEGGVITAVAEGIATVTCTAHGTDKSANCVVTVKDCNTVPTNIFSYTLGSDPTGDAAGSATMNDMFDEADNTEPEMLTQVRILLHSDKNNTEGYFLYAPDGNVGTHLKYGNVNTDYAYWTMIETGKTSSDIQKYALKNAATGYYLAKAEGYPNGYWGAVAAITTTAYVNNTAAQWHWAKSSDQDRLMNVERSDGDNQREDGEYFLTRDDANSGGVNTGEKTVGVGGSQGHQGRATLTTYFVNSRNVSNPNYLHSSVDGYYRFATGASVVATLNRAIKVNDVIRLEVKNPSDAAVSATVTIGSQVENINLAAGATSTETITVTDGSRPSSITIASDDVNFMLKSVVVNREMPNPGRNPNLAWSATPSAAHQVAAGDISAYIATRSGTGLITYTSSNESIATVAADGTVHPIAEGTVTITATLEQDGCYNDGSINYSLTLVDLPKPTITITANGEMPQGSYQTVTVTQNGDGALTFGITSGTGATLTNNGGGTYLLALAGNATDIVLTASTERTGQHAQHSVSKNISVQQCYVDGHVIYEYELTGHADADGVAAEGGTYSQANLASVGTTDNPKTVTKIKLKFSKGNGNRIYAVDNGGNLRVQDEGNVDIAEWLLIPAGETVSNPFGTNASYPVYYVCNAKTGRYIYYGSTTSGSGDWVYTIAQLSSTNYKTNYYKWFIEVNNEETRIFSVQNRTNERKSSFKLNSANQYDSGYGTDVKNDHSLLCVGKMSDTNEYSRIYTDNGEMNVGSATNPDYFYSVEKNNHTYYILNGGSVTVSRASAFKAGDEITLNVFNRGAAASNTIKVVENTIADNVNGAAELTYTVVAEDGIEGLNSFVITPFNEYICLNSISIFRPKDESEFINPTLTWVDADLSELQMIDMNNSETGMTHAATTNAPVNAAVVYSVSPADKADIDPATGALTLTGKALNKDVLTVTATLPAIGCYNEAHATYEIYVKNLAMPTLSAVFGTLQQGLASTLTVTTNSDAVPALSSISGFALNGDPVHEGDNYIYNIVVNNTVESVSVHVALAVTSDYLAAEMDAADENVTTSSLVQLYENTPEGGTLVLDANYNEGLVINKAITIDGNSHTIGNLKVENEGDLTLSSALTVADFTICAKAGNTTKPAASGQVRNATNLTVNGEAYFLYTVDPNGHVQYGWYDFTVPFRVNVMTGIKGILEGVLKEDFVNERDYAIMEHLGEKQANGEYAYKKFRGVMEPCRLYSITLDDDYNYNTIRFQKADGAIEAGNEVTLNAYASTVDDKHANWNGVGNGTLHHADAGLSVDYVQVYQSGNKTFLPVDRSNYSFVIGSAFMVQQAGSMTLAQATHNELLLAPARQESNQHSAISIQIAREDKPFSDQLFITANEDAEPVYTPGVDVAKAGNIGNVNVPQIWTNAYNSKLCAHEAQLINGKAHYELSLYAPADGTYTLTGMNIPEGSTLYLTNNGRAIWNLSINDTYSLDLTKGTHSEYGLMIVKLNNAPTEIDAISSQPSGSGKVIRNGILYILHNGKVYTAQGAVMK